MAKPQPVAVLAFFGVNVVDAPFALKDGELQSAQNAELFTLQGERSLRSRAGLVSVAAVGLGAVNGIAALPLDPPIIGTAANAKHRIYAGVSSGWIKSTDAGATFAATVDLARTASAPSAFAGTSAGAWSDFVGIKTSAQLGRQFFYYMDDGGLATFVFGYDGGAERPLTRISAVPTIAQPMFTGNGLVHLVTKQLTGSAIVAFEPVTGLPTRLGPTLPAPEVFTGGMYYQGRLWMTTALHPSGPRLLTARPADTVWTAELVPGVSASGYASIVHFAVAAETRQVDYLYVSTYSPFDSAKILRRDYAGNYTTVLISPDLGES